MTVALVFLASLAVQAAQSTGGGTQPTTSSESDKSSGVGQITYLDLEGGVGYSSNPRQAFGTSSSSSANGYVSLHAVHSRTTGRTTTLVSAFAQETAYTKHLGSTQSLSVTAHHDAAVNEQLRLYIDGAAGYDRNGQLDTRIISAPEIPVLPGSPVIPPQVLLPGSDFLAVSGKSYFFTVDGGGRLALTSRDSLDFSSGLHRNIFRSGTTKTSYWTVPATLGYSRQVNQQTDLGGRVSFVYTDYDGPLKVWTATPQLTTSLRLSEQTTLSGAIGVSFSSVDDGITTRHSTGLAANAALCNSGEFSTLCARVAVDQQTTTAAGPAKSVSAGLDYTRRLGPGSSIQLSADVNHYARPISVIAGRSFSTSNYYRVAAAYTRSFGHRLFGGVNFAARKLDSTGPDPKADISASLFIRYRFGDVQ